MEGRSLVYRFEPIDDEAVAEAIRRLSLGPVLLDPEAMFDHSSGEMYWPHEPEKEETDG